MKQAQGTLSITAPRRGFHDDCRPFGTGQNGRPLAIPTNHDPL
jgi:hypothetical protein